METDELIDLLCTIATKVIKDVMSWLSRTALGMAL